MIFELNPPRAAELTSLVEQAAACGLDRVLRLFACWCAREAEPGPSGWVEAVFLAEMYAEGRAERIQLDEKSGALGNAACAAVTVGLKNNCSNAATLLACRATLQENSSQAAISAAKFHRLWAGLEARRRGASEEGAVESVLATQIETLWAFVTNGESHLP